jgi:hypothetical protein
MLIGLDYTFRNAKKKVKFRINAAQKEIDDFEVSRSKSEFEETERIIGNPLYIERSSDYNDINRGSQ